MPGAIWIARAATCPITGEIDKQSLQAAATRAPVPSYSDQQSFVLGRRGHGHPQEKGDSRVFVRRSEDFSGKFEATLYREAD